MPVCHNISIMAVAAQNLPECIRYLSFIFNNQ